MVKDGSYEKLFEASVIHLHDTDQLDTTHLHGDRSNTVVKKGNGTGYSGHKHQKGEKELIITDNEGFIIGPVVLKPVNAHDTTILPETFTDFITFSHRIGMAISGSALTLDSGFDVKVNHKLIKEPGLLP